MNKFTAEIIHVADSAGYEGDIVYVGGHITCMHAGRGVKVLINLSRLSDGFWGQKDKDEEIQMAIEQIRRKMGMEVANKKALEKGFYRLSKNKYRIIRMWKQEWRK